MEANDKIKSERPHVLDRGFGSAGNISGREGTKSMTQARTSGLLFTGLMSVGWRMTNSSFRSDVIDRHLGHRTVSALDTTSIERPNQSRLACLKL